MDELRLDGQAQRTSGSISPGAFISLRDVVWRITRVEDLDRDAAISCVGTTGIAKGREATFLRSIEPDLQTIDPTDVELVADNSSGFRDTRLHLEAAFRGSPPVTNKPLTLGKAAIDDLAFQHLPVRMALAQPRVRLLIADDVGLGKTLEAGLVTSELVLRGKAKRILVVTTRAMLGQFQREFWTRFSIPLARLDGAAIRRMRNQLPVNYNVFDQFERVIVSIDTLKKDAAIRLQLEQSRWDLVIIDEAHNAASRRASAGSLSLRAKLARLLSRTADSLLLLTATPHDGAPESFASLIEMLDPSRVPSPERLTREDIEDLVVRRFRSTPDVREAIGRHVPQRKLIPHRFPVSLLEDRVYSMIADLRLQADEGNRRKGDHLIRTTLAKAAFSSPMACLETVENILSRLRRKDGSETHSDIVVLEELRDTLKRINAADFAKYQALLRTLRDENWNPKDPRDRIVIFSERIRTLKWLEDQLVRDLSLPIGAIARVSGGGIEADEAAQKTLEDFGQKNSPLRILLASDMASEGLNLHHQCSRLVHFDLPWSLLRFQQRNGRIDRYGQDREPRIHYFVGEGSHPKIRDMWVLEKLIDRDERVEAGLGDPAVFLRGGTAEEEEEVLLEAIDRGATAQDIDRLMDENAAAAARHDASLDDLLFAGFGDTPGHTPESLSETEEDKAFSPPRLFGSTFDYAQAALLRLAEPDVGLLGMPPSVAMAPRMLTLELPEGMRARGNFGLTSSDAVDDRYMPEDALRRGNRFQLTDDPRTVSDAIDRAKDEDVAWPEVQYLWDAHPILEWINDAVENLFGPRRVPVVRLQGVLAPGEAAVLMHGAISNRVGAPVVDLWGVVRAKPEGASGYRVSDVEPVDAFLEGIGFRGEAPNRANAEPDAAKPVLGLAVDRFQQKLIAEREAVSGRLKEEQLERLKGLERFREKWDRQLQLDFGTPSGTPAQTRREEAKRERVAEIFRHWERWYEDTCEITRDPYPFVDIRAVFQG